MRWLAGILVVTACGSAPPRASSPDAARKAETAAQFNVASFSSRLAELKLEPVAIPSTRDMLGEGMVMANLGDPDARQPRPAGHVFEQNGQTFVAGPTVWSGDATQPPAWEFVRDAQGDIYRIERRPRIVETQTVREPGCQHPVFGSPCPACGSTDQVLYGPLPAGAQFKGSIEVAYDEKVVQTVWAEGMCNDPPPP